jgi:hypothetical protein
MLVAPGQAAQEPHPSSVTPSQSSSTELHTSAGGAQAAPHSQLPLHVCVPVEPQVVVQDRVAPAQQVDPSSQTVSQSSSMPLQTSAGGAQMPQAHDKEQTRVPAEPQVVVQAPVAPRQQVNPLSQVVSQSSSDPLHVSVGGVQEPQTQLAEQSRVPVDRQVVTQEPLVPRQQANPLSQPPTQSSSTPLQVSAGGVQPPQPQPESQVRVPLEPQPVVQEPVDPRQQT